MKKTLKTLLYGSIFALASLLPYKVHAAEQFIRGDTNQDEIVDISDSINTLEYLFLGGQKPECLDAADVDDNGKIEVTDAVYGLEYMFKGGQKPPAPFPNMGYDLTKDELDCRGQSDLEARIIMQRDIPLVIRESGTPERPLVYVLGEDVVADGTAITIGEVNNIDMDGKGYKISYGSKERNAYGIVVFDGNEITLKNIKLYESTTSDVFSSGKTAISLFNTHNSILTDLDLSTTSLNSAGISLSTSQDNEISQIRMTINGFNSPGISFYKADSNTLANVHVINIGVKGRGILLRSSSDNAFLENKLDIIGQDSSGVAIFESSNKNILYNSIFNINPSSSDAYFSVDSSGNLDLINTIFNNKIIFGSSATGISSNGRLNVYWNLGARITDTTNNPLEAALVEGYDTNNNPIFSEYTNPDGRIPRRELLSYTQDKDGIKQAYPYTIKVSKPGYQTKNDIFDFTGNVDLRYALEPKSN